MSSITSSGAPIIRRALLSVSDKTGIVEFAQALHQRGVTLLSTGGTAKLLQQQNIPVTEVADYTGFPEIMQGRVKTLHPKIHGGLLGRRETDVAVMEAHDIAPIDLLAVNLYPFQATIAQPDCDLATAIEQIDIGGPTMLRAAAKNHRAVTVVVDQQDYARIIDEIDAHQGATVAHTRFQLACKTFSHTAQYDAAISNYLGCAGQASPFPSTYTEQFIKQADLRYGENPHQQAAFYVAPNLTQGTVASAEQLQGKALSYNNIADADAALECVKAFGKQTACCIVKHANPCGVALSDSQLSAYEQAFSTDPTSAFGGIIAFNTELAAPTAEKIIANQFVEVIIAPDVSRDAIEILRSKKNIRLLRCGALQSTPQPSLDYKRVANGLLVQDTDIGSIDADELKIVTQQQPDAKQLADLLIAWKIVKFVKSNAIVYVKDNMTVGIGAGQMSRVISAEIAGIKAQQAGLAVEGAVMASDAFFPFRDGIDAAAKAGIRAIIQPGGSIRDEEVIAAADEAGIAMVFTGMRHFKH